MPFATIWGLDASKILVDCSTLNAASSGLYYITGNCSLTGVVGSATDPVILVITGDGNIGPNAIIFGMLFIHKDNI